LDIRKIPTDGKQTKNLPVEGQIKFFSKLADYAVYQAKQASKQYSPLLLE
jgi:hypothetical protein